MLHPLVPIYVHFLQVTTLYSWSMQIYEFHVVLLYYQLHLDCLELS